MANKMTGTQYNQIKNESYAVLKFRDGRRVITITGMSFFDVVSELVEKTKGEMVTLVINEKDLPMSPHGFVKISHSKDIKDFEDLFKLQRKLF